MSYLSSGFCNNATASPFNIIPNEWYHTFTDKRGSPDLTAISILSEIVYWYKPTKDGAPKFKGDAWETSYSHFERKFGFYHEKIRRAFISLEEKGIIQRDFRTIEVRGQRYSNKLFIHLSQDVLKEFGIPSIISQNNKGLKTSPKKIGSTSNDFFASQHVDPSPQIEGEYYKDKENNIKKSRSIVSEETRSNFLNKNFEVENSNLSSESKQNEREGEGGILALAQKTKTTPKTLSDFYPLSQKDHEELQSLSGRDFDLNAMNEILLSMSKKERLQEARFFSKKGFLSYMSKALAHEKRQAEKINNLNFKINNNRTSEELTLLACEKYLNEVESSLDTSELGKFKKKLASSFDVAKSYKILLALKTCDRVGENIEAVFNKYITLSDIELSVIKSHLISVYKPNHHENSKDIKIIIPSPNIKCNMLLAPIDKGTLAQSSQLIEEPAIPQNIWGMVRTALITIYGTGVDKSWFSQLHASVDEKEQKLDLHAPTTFVGNWIKSNFLDQISKFAKGAGFEVSLVYP